MHHMKNENDYILAFSGILERMAADGYDWEDVEDVFYTAMDEVALFDDIEEDDDYDDYEDT